MRAGRLLLPALLATSACGSTTDSLGHNGPSGVMLHPLTPLSNYPNALAECLMTPQADIDAKINGTWNQLFYGTADQVIYYPVGADQAEIRDILHGDIRTEGIGYAMMIAVQLDKRTEFDRMWTYAKVALRRPATDPAGGYYKSSCDTLTMVPVGCNDPFGHAQFVTALLFAKGRWASAGTHDYGLDAVELLHVMRHKEDINDGVLNGVTNTFDSETGLPFDVPEASSAGVSRPSVAMPAFYELWAQATRDPFWTRAAAAAREYWKRSAHGETGLMPVRAKFDGEPVPGSQNFQSESYRAQINLVLDDIWFAREPWERAEATKLLQFFSLKGINSYVGSYTLDGDVLGMLRDYALVAANGATAMISTAPDRCAYVKAVWDMSPQAGPARYYSGLLNLTAMLILSGQYQIR